MTQPVDERSCSEALQRERSSGAGGSVLHAGWRSTRRFIILLLGLSVLLVGVAMVVLPGPAIVVIPAGLGILATEFLWARRLLKRLAALVPAGPRRRARSNGAALERGSTEDNGSEGA